MKKLLGVLLLSLITISPVYGAQTSITAGEGPFFQGQHYETNEIIADWASNRNLDFWAGIRCSNENGFVLDTYQSLSRDVQQNGVTFASNFWAEGGANCTLRLFGFNKRGGFSQDLAFDTFVVLP